MYNFNVIFVGTQSHIIPHINFGGLKFSSLLRELVVGKKKCSFQNKARKVTLPTFLSDLFIVTHF